MENTYTATFIWLGSILFQQKVFLLSKDSSILIIIRNYNYIYIVIFKNKEFKKILNTFWI